MHNLITVMNILVTVHVLLLLHLQTEFTLLPLRLYTCAWDVLLQVLLVLVKLKQPRIYHQLLQKLFMFSIVLIKWTIRVWQVFSRALQLRDHGDVSTSLTDWFLRSYLFVLYNLSLLLMLSKVKEAVSRLKVMRWTLIQLVELSLP